MSTITRTSDSATSTPSFVTGYEASYQGRNITHNLIGGGLAVVMIAQNLRTGTLHLHYTDEAAAWDAVALHLVVSTFEFLDGDVEGVSMTYTAGTVSPVVRAQDADVWLVDVEYQEIEP